MNRRKICLFTAHSPEAGGGSTILRSLVENLPEFHIVWYYISDKAALRYESGYLGKPLMGGGLAKDVWQTFEMLTGGKITHLEKLIGRLMEVDCDAYWIVSHNEGLRVAQELAKRQKRPVHLTVHDDWAGALCARSVRYRFLGYFADKLTINVLKSASSFDVVSSGMQNYYRQLSGIKGEICHRYLLEASILYNKDLKVANSSIIIAGHIGSIYDKDDFVSFLSLFVKVALINGKKPVVKMWGCHLSKNDIPVNLRDFIQFLPTLPEENVIPELSRCTFVYAMYPLNNNLHVFSKTSLPTKLTSYLQAGRPIFGHGPKDSTLSCFVSINQLGVLWASRNEEDGIKAIEKILMVSLDIKKLKDARTQYFGEHNLDVMRKALSN